MTPGIYGLLIHLKKGTDIDYGNSSRFFQKGYSVYSGSAQRGLETRLQRHFRETEPKSVPYRPVAGKGNCSRLLDARRSTEIPGMQPLLSISILAGRGNCTVFRGIGL